MIYHFPVVEEIIARKMVLDITQEDIDKGRPGIPESCPISLSARRAGFNQFVETGSYSVSDSERCYVMSDKAREFVSCFDKREKVEPTQVTIYWSWGQPIETP